MTNRRFYHCYLLKLKTCVAGPGIHVKDKRKKSYFHALGEARDIR